MSYVWLTTEQYKAVCDTIDAACKDLDAAQAAQKADREELAKIAKFAAALRKDCANAEELHARLIDKATATIEALNARIEAALEKQERAQSDLNLALRACGAGGGSTLASTFAHDLQLVMSGDEDAKAQALAELRTLATTPQALNDPPDGFTPIHDEQRNLQPQATPPAGFAKTR